MFKDKDPSRILGVGATQVNPGSCSNAAWGRMCWPIVEFCKEREEREANPSKFIRLPFVASSSSPSSFSLYLPLPHCRSEIVRYATAATAATAATRMSQRLARHYA
jgi:hypothetical protein